MRILVQFKNLLKDWGTLVTVITFLVLQWTKVERHEATIIAWQQVGTPQLVAIKATYDERFKSQQERIERLETIAVSNNAGIQDIKTALRANEVMLGAIKEALQQHMSEMKGK